jgi:hypothetical protein
MKLLLSVALAVILMIGCSPKDKAPETTAGPEKGELEGKWKVRNMGGNGKSTPPEEIADMEVIISGNQYTMKKGGQIVEQATIVQD